ncbi:MAG: hypothetical protein HDT36_00110 [Clostridiales bacterium]|nr:hypothetical protein [Clostridiales bacterium]
MSIQSEFEEYLIARGYKQQTPKGKPSTVKNYINSINLVCKQENCSWEELARKIFRVIDKYSKNGLNSSIGEKGHKTVINALKQFKKFCFDYCSI